jgi:hypothetical protein
MADYIDREVYEGVGPGDIDVRLYEDTRDSQIPKLPSVTTILETRDDDKSNLYDWQDRNDGVGNNAHHEHLFWYSRHVGTLGHWHALHELDDSLEWTEDEEQSKRELERMYEDEVADDSPREVLYSVLRGDRDKEGGIVSTWGEFYDRYPPYKNGDYYRNALMERAEQDIEFFKDGILRLWNKLGISPLNTISVEQFLFNEEYGYAGQVDLVYEDADGYIVVADLKSSSGCYDKHQIQGAAYAKSVELAEDIPEVEEVDRLEVHRAHPRTGQMAAHTHRDAPGKSSVHTTKYWNDGMDDLWMVFESLISNFDGYDWGDVE